MRPSAPPTDDELRDVPVFPLPDLVLFPSTPVPLHFFEPRYRAMVEDCLAFGPRTIAIARFEPGWEPHYDGAPKIRAVGSVGRLVAHRARPEGTHDVVLLGLSRVEIHEHAGSPRGYRRARLDVLRDLGAAPTPADASVLLACANAIASRLRRDQPTFSLGLRGSEAANELVDVLADRLVADPELRQHLLECLDPKERLRIVTEEASRLLLRMRDDAMANC